MAGKTLRLEGLTADLDDQIKERLELYFRNKRKSGGVISELRADPTDRRGASLLYGDDQDLNNILSKKTHEVDLRGSLGLVTLSVTLPEAFKAESVLSSETVTESVFASNRQQDGISVGRYKEKEEDMVDKRRFVLSGMASSCSSETISLFIHSCSNWAPHSWERGGGDSIVVTFREDPDGHKFMQNVFSKRCQFKKIEARPLKFTSSIIIQGDKSHISDDFWKIYFCKEQRHEGEIIKSIVHVKKNKSMVITFEDWKVARRVAEKKHTLFGKEFVAAQLFYPDLQWVLTGQTEPQSDLSTDKTVPVWPQHCPSRESNARREIQTPSEKNMVDHIPMEDVNGSTPKFHVATTPQEEVETLEKVIKSKMENTSDELQILKNTVEKEIQLDSKERLDLTVDNVLGESVMLCVELSKDTENLTIHLKGSSANVQEAETFIHKFQDTLTPKELDYSNIVETDYSNRSPQSPCLKVTATSDQIKKALDEVNMHKSQITTRRYMYSKAGESKILKKNTTLLKMQAKGFGCNLEVSQNICSTFTDDLKCHVTSKLAKGNPKITKGLKSANDLGNPSADPTKTRTPLICSAFAVYQLSAFSSLLSNTIVIAGVSVTLKKVDIIKENVDVIVNSNNQSLDLNLGVSGAILNAAGPSVVDECKKHGFQAIGNVVLTGGGNLDCKYIAQIAGTEDITAAILNVLQLCESKQAASVSLPSIGTGRGDRTPKESATAILQALKMHLLSFPISSLKNISVVAFDYLTYLSMQKYFDKCCHSKAKNADSQINSVRVTTLGLPLNQVKIQDTLIELKKGKITEEIVKAIVNSTNAAVNRNSGVSGAILNAAGDVVKKECAMIRPLKGNDAGVTSGGSLQCDFIIHIVGPKNVGQAFERVKNVLELCEDKKMTSVSFPAIGTGDGGMNIPGSISALLFGIKQHLSQHNCSSLKQIFLVVDQDLGVQECQQSLLVWTQDMVDEDEIRNYSSSGEYISGAQIRAPQAGAGPYPTQQPSLCLAAALRAVSFPEVEVEVLGCCSSDVEKVKKLVDDLVTNEWKSCPISSPLLSQLLEAEKQNIVDLSRELQVCVSLSAQDKATASGKAEDALTMVLRMQKYLQSAKERVSRQEEAKRLGETVRWEVSDGEAWKELDPMVSLDLESARSKKEPSISYTEQQQVYTVNLDKMEQTDGNRTIAKLKRTLKAHPETAVIEPPANWDQMDNKTLDKVELSPSSEEYKKVQEDFIKTSKDSSQPKCTVVKIQRIESIEQWQRYAVKKQMLDKKYPNAKNEMNLYHGTTAEICQKINNYGFNRSFCGRNAISYGRGTYFALESWYSCQNKFSEPDGQGVKYMYQARVLVGKPCLGHKGMVEPTPLDPANPQSGLHDCAVDNIQRPFIYVVFIDAGAYPEYLISFKAS